MPQPDSTSPERFVVIVVRSGGIAGLSKQWRAEPDPERAPRWRELVESCPWDAAATASPGADRYQWRIEVHRGDTAVHRARLGDAQIEGPWRTLVDEVRHAASPSPRER
ncbi:protealysin inhibitor emfourin [Microbacterium sp. BWR-S6Y]|uniref:protealysin inhibitor emfourin n=1 Tax=Microbacterium sp. BWR-S6Y TaxID=3232073 RepID=UPI003526C5AC